jgi:hypothetical protein
LALQGHHPSSHRGLGRKESPKKKKGVPENSRHKPDAILYVIQDVHAVNIPAIALDGNFHKSIVSKADGVFLGGAQPGFFRDK